MSILAECSCGSQVRLPNSYEGKEVKCLKCGKMVKVGGGGPGLTERKLQVGPVTLVARCESQYANQAEAVLKRIAANQNEGIGLVDRARISFGWSEFQLQKRGPDLVVCEADYTKNPWSDTRDDINVAIQVGLSQSEFARRFSVRPMTCTFVQSIETTDNCFNESDLIMRRIRKPKDDDSGWFISPADPAKSIAAHEKGEFDRILSYQLLTLRPGMLQALLLPIEYKVTFHTNTLISVIDADDNELLATDV